MPVKLNMEQRQEADKLLERAEGSEDFLRELIYELIELRERDVMWNTSHGPHDE